MSFAFNEGQRNTLAAICDTILPRLSEAQQAEMLRRHPHLDAEHLKAFCGSSGTDLGAVAVIERAVATHLPEDAKSGFSMLLTAFGSRLGMLLLCGYASPFAALSPEQRAQALLGLKASRFQAKQKVFASLKGLVLSKALSLDTAKVNPSNHGQDVNSVWASMGYDGTPSVAEAVAEAQAAGREEFEYTMLNDSITKDTSMAFDVVVVGSGCGGSVVAAELAQAGKRVLVVDKGPYVKRKDLTCVEGSAFETLYDRGGMISAEDSGLGVLAGSCFGGGSTVNWACSLATPSYVKEEWSKKHGMPAFTDGTFDAALDAVCRRVGVKSEGVTHNEANKLLIKGCEKLGYDINVAPQAMGHVSWFPGGGFISCGDPYGVKQSTPVTFLRDAATASTPAQFADRCHVKRVLHKKGAATGVEASIVGAGGASFSLVVNAPVVVVSCGSIQSPAVLLRSNLPDPHKQIGKNLRLHPVVSASGIMPKDHQVGLWRGAPMTTVSNVAVAGPDNDMYGSKLEVPNVHPGLFSAMVPWKSGAAVKDCLTTFSRAANVIVLSRDKNSSGEVQIDNTGMARVFYPVDDGNRRALLQGLEKALRILEAAGAEALMLPHYDEPVPLPADSEQRKQVLDKVIKETQRIGFPPFKVQLFSAHQMGTCRMGSDRKASVVQPSCESWECSGLYVADASCFPTATGTNPMITTYAIAYMAAQGMKKRFAAAPRSSL